jgi:hypothetical protein
VLAIELPWSRLHAHAIARVEALRSLPDGALVVARCRRTRGAWIGDPLSVIRPGREINPVDALHFDGEATSALVGRLLASASPDSAPDDGAGVSDTSDLPAGLPVPLIALRSLLEQQAQRGCAGAPTGSVHDRLGATHRALRDIGWGVFAAPDPAVDPAVVLLRSHYVLQQVERTFR